MTWVSVRWLGAHKGFSRLAARRKFSFGVIGVSNTGIVMGTLPKELVVEKTGNPFSMNVGRGNSIMAHSFSVFSDL
jgi:hypothetical protein